MHDALSRNIIHQASVSHVSSVFSGSFPSSQMFSSHKPRGGTFCSWSSKTENAEKQREATAEQEPAVSSLSALCHKCFRCFEYFISFQIPLNLPCSVTLQPGPEDTGKVKPRRSLSFSFALCTIRAAVQTLWV